jgi:3-hydroxyacyl-[acyl-carrier-protein] dehydratase
MSHTLDVEEIRSLLPHRYPMLLVDRILELEAGERAVGLKNVTINEPFFNGHFPGQAIMPGVLILEAMAQVAGLMMLSLPNQGGKLAYIAEIESARFRRPVVPGDTLITEAIKVWVRTASGFGKVRMTARVDNELVAECEMKFALKPITASEQVQAKLEQVRQSGNGGSHHSAGGHIDAKPIHRQGQTEGAEQELRGDRDCE